MKTLEVKESFMIDIHKHSSLGIKERIEKELPNLFKPKLGWFWADEEAKSKKTFLLYEQGTNDTYGFGWSGNWCDKLFVENSNSRIPATREEVQEALINEAKKRGFKEGVRFKLIEGVINSIAMFGNYAFKYELQTNRLLIESDNGCVLYTLFKDGKWAEIIDDKSELKEAIAKLKKELKNLESQL